MILIKLPLAPPKVTNLFPNPNLAPLFGCNHLGAYLAPLCVGYGVLNYVLGFEYIPSGWTDNIKALPSSSIADILPFKGLDQLIFLNCFSDGNSSIYSPVLKLTTTVLKSLAEDTTRLGSVSDHATLN